MIAITKDTYPVALAHNPMAVQVTMTDIYEEYYSAGGSLAEFNFGITPASFVAGEIWNLYSPIMGLISFSISATPDLADASQLWDSTYGTGFANYREYLFDKLSKHPLLNKYYHVESYIDGSGILFYKIAGRKHHADYFMQTTYTGTTVSVLNVGFPNPLLSETDLLKKNINIKMRLWVEDSLDSPNFHEAGVYQGIGIDQHDANMMVVEFYDIPAQLIHQLNAELPSDAFNVFKCGNICKRYYYEVWAEWLDVDNTPKYTSMLKSDIKHMILGGIDKEHGDWYAHWLNYYRNEMTDAPEWLTFQRTNMVLNVNQYQWLAIFIDEVTISTMGVGPTYELFVEGFYAGVSAASLTIPLTLFDTISTGLYYIPAGYQQLNISGIESAGTFDSYTVVIREVDASALNTPIQISVDKENNKYGAVIGYHTSLGAFETFMNDIRDELSIKTTNNDSTHVMLENDRVSTGTIGTVYISDQKHMKLRTGWICGAFKNIINDFLLAKYKYMIPRSIADSDQLPNYKRIQNMSDEVSIKNHDYMYEMEWELSEAWTDSVFSDMNVLDETNYTDLIEFRISNNTNDDEDFTLQKGSWLAILYVNNIKSEYNIGTNTYTVPKNTINVYKIRVKDIGGLSVENASGNLTIIIDTIKASKMSTIALIDFKNVVFSDVYQFLNLKSLLYVGIINILNQYIIDTLLQVFQTLYINNENLIDITITGTTAPAPSPVGINAKDWLIDQGVTVTTN